MDKGKLLDKIAPAPEERMLLARVLDKLEQARQRNIPVSTDCHEFELHPEFNRELIDMGNNNYDMRLSVAIAPSDSNPLPFELRAVIVGHFSYNDPNQEFSEQNRYIVLKRNTVSILFPFLRAIVASLTTAANIPTLVFPIMNFSEME